MRKPLKIDLRWLAALWLAVWSHAFAGSAAAQSAAGIGMAEPRPSGSGVVVYEEQWAKTLVRALALDEVLPDEPDDADLFALLCADAAEMVTDAEGRRAPARAAFQISREMSEGRKPGEPVRVVLDVPATALYQLMVEGSGKQRWTVDQRAIGHLDASELGAAFGPRVIPLREGPHELAGYMGRDARIERVELQAFRPLCIAPGSGWRAGRPLTVGAQARTLVRALGLDRYLPELRRVVALEGERFASASQWGGRTNALPEGMQAAAPASPDPQTGRARPRPPRAEWARAGSHPAEFTYRIRLPQPGVFTIEARLTPGSRQIWSVDGRYRTQVDAPDDGDGFVWTHLMTTSLVAGEHVLRALVPPGAGIDRLRVVKRQSTDPDYAEVLEQMGFPAGATHALVTRGVVFESISHPAFQQLADGFLTRVAGSAAEAPLVAWDDELPKLYSRPMSLVLPAEL
ncbi:MAG: hypothetical protein ACQGVC_16105 [Myxococcota bacterium]